MDERFKWKASQRTDDELNDRVNNRPKYLPETVEASVAELQNRGAAFGEDELTRIEHDVQAKQNMANTPAGYDSLFNNADKIRQVEDPDAPAFYSKRAIYAFSIVCGVLFGSIMFAINVWKTPKRNNVVWVILYGIAYTIAQILVGERIHTNTGFAIVTGILGAYPLNYFFWGSFLGKGTLYRAKPIWTPLIITIAIYSVIIALFLYASSAV